MSRDASDAVPPRRPGSSSGRSGAPRKKGEPDEQPSTFRPSAKPAKPGSPARGSSLPKTEREPMPAGPSWWERIVFGQVGSGQLARFCRQFAAYLDAGVDIMKALTGLEEQFARTALGPVIGRLRLSVRRGDALAEAVAREPQAFDTLFLSLIRVAEARGGVPETLHRLARHYEARQSLIRQARSAAIYPIAVLVVASGVVAFITIWLLPKFIALLNDIKGRTALPLPSRALMAFSSFVSASGWWMIPLAMAGLPYLALQVYKTPAGKRAMDELALYVPVLGKLLQKIDTARFAQTLSVLLGSGVDVGASLDLTASVMRLDPYRRAVQGAKLKVLHGEELSQTLAESRRFGPDVIAIVGTGEETGQLPESLERLAGDYEEQVSYMVKNMGQLVQPLLMIILGAIVLFIILAVLLPYISLITSLSGGAGGG